MSAGHCCKQQLTSSQAAATVTASGFALAQRVSSLYKIVLKVTIAPGPDGTQDCGSCGRDSWSELRLGTTDLPGPSAQIEHAGMLSSVSCFAPCLLGMLLVHQMLTHAWPTCPRLMNWNSSEGGFSASAPWLRCAHFRRYLSGLIRCCCMCPASQAWRTFLTLNDMQNMPAGVAPHS